MKYSSLLPTLCATFSLSAVRGNPYTISDERVRGMDITPALGRGYSIMTNTFQSTCLVVEEVTVPSYNYDYFFTDFTTSEDTEETLGGKISVSFSFGGILALLFGGIDISASVESTSTSKTSSKTQLVVATMRLERYYSSVREDQSPLADDAITLLGAQDYVGFFKACGPNYVRGIRRAQELTAMFSFASTSRETDQQFAATLQVNVGETFSAGAESQASSKFNAAASSLVISIQGWGLGLSQEGSDSLVATSLEDYQAVLKFAFTSATQNEDSHNIGMVYGIEVVPWVNNLSFQVNARVMEEVVVITLPRSMVPKAFIQETDGTITEFQFGDARDNYQCKEPTAVFDKFGYCCETQWLYDPITMTYDPTLDPAADDSTAICRPKRDLDKSLVKENMANNGEYIARLDGAMRYRLATIAQLEHCISTARSYPPSYELQILKQKDVVGFERRVNLNISLGQLKKAVDPRGDYGLLTHMTRELGEWIKMFYSPCIAALYGMNEESSPSVDESYFMAYPWYAHDECMHLACLTNKMRWDRENGGCVPSLITGAGATAYGDAAAEVQCSSDIYSANQAAEECEYSNAALTDFHTYATTCWGGQDILPNGAIDYLIEQYCQPQLTPERVDDETYTAWNSAVETSCPL